ncbi:hypothetical protein SDRG_14410 [Saprolegnia diclina VS20]|uniref:F-box domain-containing protein n=1 Tax=Saprolegnia diclina (strain VS20) TaxID=1156394 RepID=T0PZZ5_SAPDV|nr:hypothetical protein SDRG_14410 [Saprolegnia diclina VS20]EQC27826.1 hypothetical protein SDRG_14410 [Saprolegnia diclina VS20]|eukprot:XP_008618756.1 hypothetical protein SDRG_14410 [Saprolegnia diclina VS20]
MMDPRPVKRRCGRGSAMLIGLAEETLMDVYRCLDGRSIQRLSSTCRSLRGFLDAQWKTLFTRYLGIEFNMDAACWREYLKRFYCAMEKRCCVCLMEGSPAIRPWQFINLCDDHRKHAIKSVLISKTYAKEQFSLNDADLAPLQFILRGRMKLFLESEALYCALRKHGGHGGLKKIQDKKIIRWEKRQAIKEFRGRQVELALADEGVSMSSVSPDFCTTYADFITQPKSKNSLKTVVRCITGHILRVPEQSTREALRLDALRKHMQQMGQSTQFDPTLQWVIDYAVSTDVNLTPAKAFSKAAAEALRKEELNALLDQRGLPHDACVSVFGDTMTSFIEQGELKIGFGQYINTAAQVASVVDARAKRLQDVLDYMFPNRMHTTDEGTMISTIFSIRPLHAYVLDGVVRFFGEVHVAAQSVVDHYMSIMRRQGQYEAKIVQWLDHRKISMSAIGIEKGFLANCIAERGLTSKSVESMLRQVLDESTRTSELLAALPSLTFDSKEMQTASVQRFIQHGYVMLNRSFFSDVKAFAQALWKQSSDVADRRRKLRGALQAMGNAVTGMAGYLDMDSSAYHVSVFRVANEFIEQGGGNLDDVAKRTFANIQHEVLLWKAVEALGLSMRMYHECFVTLGDALVREFIHTGSVWIEGWHSRSAKKLILYLIFLYKCPTHHNVVVREILRVCLQNAQLGPKVPPALGAKFVLICNETRLRVEASCFTNTWKNVVTVVEAHVNKHVRQETRFKALHAALVQRQWPLLAYSTLELKLVYLQNGLPCYCGVEVTTMDQLVDVLIDMHCNASRRQDALESAWRAAGIPPWTSSINVHASWLFSAYVRCGSVMLSEDTSLDSIAAVTKHVIESSAYERQMQLTNALVHYHLELPAVVADLDASVGTTILDWVQYGTATRSLKATSVPSTAHVLDFILEHAVNVYGVCKGCATPCRTSAIVACAQCDSALCPSCLGACAVCSRALCSRCTTLDADTVSSRCIGDCLSSIIY